jgi:putative membrane protein
MILPGISGSFILLLLGMYTTILTAIKEFDFAVIALFAAGAASGLLAFSRVLSWAFSHYRSMTLALLSGFLLGSLNKVWPWKYTLSYTINSKGHQVPLVEQNVTPVAFTDLTGEPSQLTTAILLMLVGLVVVLLIDRLPSRG